MNGRHIRCTCRVAKVVQLPQELVLSRNDTADEGSNHTHLWTFGKTYGQVYAYVVLGMVISS